MSSIGAIRNQGHCGSCWAFAAVESLADRFCIASNGTEILKLSAQSLIDCDRSDGGCHGGYLDLAWKGLVSRGALSERCDPYEYCAYPPLPNCSRPGVRARPTADWLQAPPVCPTHCAAGEEAVWYRAASAYAVGDPGDVAAMQRELLSRGPFEVAFFVYSDFMTYRGGVYRKGAGAHGPLGGHAVKLVGWGEDGGEPYWLVANSWSPAWGEDGFFRILRGTNECGIETTPAAGMPSLTSARAPPAAASRRAVMTEREATAVLLSSLADARGVEPPSGVQSHESAAPSAASNAPPRERSRKRPLLQTQFAATMRLAQTDHGPDGEPGDGCILARQLKPPHGIATSPIWFDAVAGRIAQINSQYEYHPARALKTVSRYDLPSFASLLIEPFFNETVCYAQRLRGLCPNGTTTCPPTFGHFGQFGTPFTATLGLYYLNTSFLGTGDGGDELWQWTWNNPTLMPNGSTVNITRNFTYHVAPPTDGAPPDAPRALRRYEWTQGLPNGGSHDARLCTVVDFTDQYSAGPPDVDNFAPPAGIGSCVWP